MKAIPHPKLENHWLVGESQISVTATYDEEGNAILDEVGNAVTEEVETITNTQLVACAPNDSSAERAVELLEAEPVVEEPAVTEEGE